jgi:hypothetical protein
MLERLETDPQIGGALVARGWVDEALPALRRHLAQGRKLDRHTLPALVALGEPEMGPALESQFLRLDDPTDELVAAMRDHPGVDWNRLRREAWRRAKFGHADHHLFVKWGAELGDREALRRLLVKALDGHSWERGILGEWFGGDRTPEQLAGQWERLAFVNGGWRVR